MAGRYALAPLRCAVLVLVALACPVVLVVTFVCAHAGVPSPALVVAWARALPGLARRLAGRWSGEPIDRPYHPPPEPPRRDLDGWYRHGDDLFRSPWIPGYLRGLEWVARDPATARDLWWMLLDPLVGGVLAALPPLLIGYGAISADRPIGWAAAALGVAAGPAALRLHGRWTRVLLSPVRRRGPSPLWSWTAPRMTAVLRLAAVTALSVAGAALAVAHVAGPGAVPAARRFVSWRRALAGRWNGAVIAEPYAPEPAAPEPDPDGGYRVGWLAFGSVYRSPERAARARRLQWIAEDPASWRDLLWLALEPLCAVVLAAPPVSLVAGGLVWLCWLWTWTAGLALVLPGFTWSPMELVGAVIPALEQVPGPLLGLPAAALGLATAPALLRLHGRVCGLLLAPTRTAALTRRVEHLAVTRAQAAGSQAAELRRIERDLYDGAQARWVAMGMNLGVAEHLVDRDPAAAKAVLAQAKQSAASALSELRELIRGIHPPILADRGLPDALRTLAMDAPLDADVRIDLRGRPDPHLEAAVYFAVSELLTNVGKHASATRVAIELTHADGVLRCTVSDDGRGGAVPGGGSGLEGIRRRLSGFDGTLTLSSPPGGPTVAAMELPCVLS
ncbi:sensor histidine kinase [Nonomuraea dietziae]|uniref:sensor histidine kinase n=1 Tax=Nonomuraea dietziae TaxID=65515 RepID=UPI0033C1B426